MFRWNEAFPERDPVRFGRLAALLVAAYCAVAAVLLGPYVIQRFTADDRLEDIAVRPDLSGPQRNAYIRTAAGATVTFNMAIWDEDEGLQAGRGTGAIFGTEGYILTAAHVVENMEGLTVSYRLLDPTATAYEEFREEPIDVLAIDSACDMAIVKLRHPESATMKTFAYQTDADPKVGEKVWYIGSTTGVGELSVIETGATREVGSLNDREKKLHVGLTIAAGLVMQGDSGGPILDGAGRIVGVVSSNNIWHRRTQFFPLSCGFAKLLAKAEAVDFIEESIKNGPPTR